MASMCDNDRVQVSPRGPAKAHEAGSRATRRTPSSRGGNCSCPDMDKASSTRLDPRNETGTFHVLAGVVTGPGHGFHV